MNIVIVGHVDHGKSTIIGRLLADTNYLPEGKLEKVKLNCEKNSKPFEYAFLIDALKDEQSQGITIDSARVFFKTKKRPYIIIDAPGHIEFLKNMITGASRAEAALLVIDAYEGIQENSKRHCYMLSMLGISQIIVLINKMDLIGYNEKKYLKIKKDYSDFLNKINIKPFFYIPVSGVCGDNIARKSEKTTWFEGYTVLQALDKFKVEEEKTDHLFRMTVQDIYKFTKFGDSRRIISGTISSGQLKKSDNIIFYPSGKKSQVKRIESFNKEEILKADAGKAIGFTVNEQIYIPRGEMISKMGQTPPFVSTSMKVSLFWTGKEPMKKNKEYYIKICTSKSIVILSEILNIIDASSLNSEKKNIIERNDIAECILKLKKPVAFDTIKNVAETSRFVIVDNYEISGGGIIHQSLDDKQSEIRNKVLLRNYKWERSAISSIQRAERYNQKSTLIFITGEKNTGKKTLARKIEKILFEAGKYVYFLGIGNILYGIDSDIKGKKDKTQQRAEHLRRLAEVAHILLDTGIILIITAIKLTQEDIELIKISVNSDKIHTVWLGEKITTDINYDIHITEEINFDEAVNIIKEDLQNNGVIFRI